MVKKDKTTLVNSEKLRELFDKNPLDKAAITQLTQVPPKTIQRALSKSKKVKHRINKDSLQALANYFQVNYSDLIIGDENEKPVDANRTELHRVYDLRYLKHYIRNASHLHKAYNFNMGSETGILIKKILETIKTTKFSTVGSANDEDIQKELDYIDWLSNGNAAIANLSDRKVFIYAGQWTVRFFGQEKMTVDDYDGGENATTDKFTVYKPFIKTNAMICFSTYEVDKQIIFPNLGFSNDSFFQTYKELLNRAKVKDPDMLLGYYFPIQMDLDYDQQEQNYHQLNPFLGREYFPTLDLINANDQNFPFSHQEFLFTKNNPSRADESYHGKFIPVSLKSKKKEADMK